jgi:1-deoxy-D-xylulose-5-phosphate synthase
VQVHLSLHRLPFDVEQAVTALIFNQCGELIVAEGLAVPVLRVELPYEFIRHGDRSRLLELNDLDIPGVWPSVRAFAGHLLGVVDVA